MWREWDYRIFANLYKENPEKALAYRKECFWEDKLKEDIKKQTEEEKRQELIKLIHEKWENIHHMTWLKKLEDKAKELGILE